MDPTTSRVVGKVPVVANSRYGGAYSGDGRLFEVDPATDEVVAEGSLGGYGRPVAGGGRVWLVGGTGEGALGWVAP